MTGRAWRVLISLFVCALLGAACGGDGGDDGGGAAPEDEAPRVIPEDLPTVGVTEDGVTVGVLISTGASGAAVSGQAGTPPEELEANQRFWIDHVNKNGGIAGHQIEPVFAVIDSFKPETHRPGCIKLTEDNKSFVVLGYTHETLCFTQEHKTIFFANAPNDQPTIDASGPYLLQWQMNPERVMASLVEALEKEGKLKDQKIGIVTDARPASVSGMEAATAQLKKLGYDVVTTSTLSGTDAAAAQAAIPLEVRKFAEAGVTLVLWPGTAVYGPGWTAEAAKQGWEPTYAFSELNGGTGLDSYPGWPTTLKAIGYASTDQPMDANAGNPAPTSPLTDKCREIYKESTGQDFDPNSTDRTIRAQYTAKIAPCRDWLFMQEIGESLEGELTTSSFLTAISEFDNWDFYVRPPGGSWAPRRGGITNSWRRVEWSHPCPVDPENLKPGGCWVATSQFQPMPVL